MEDGSGVRTRTWTVRRPPLSPPAGVAPFAGVGYPCSQPPWAASLGPRKPLARGPSPRNPHVRGRVLARRAACAGVMAGVRWRERGRAVARRVACGGRHGRRAPARRGRVLGGTRAGCGRYGRRVLARRGGAAVWVAGFVAAVPVVSQVRFHKLKQKAILSAG